MLNKSQSRLVLLNVAVFTAVLSIFCAAVYYLSCSAFDEQLRDKLASIADSAISSIDFEDPGDANNGKPDLIVSVLGDEVSPSLQSMKIQWFSPDGKLDIEKGTMTVTVPLMLTAGYQSQNQPDALVYTKPAIAEGKLLGYVRVGHPLKEQQEQKLLLLRSFILGLVVAALASGVGVYFLVRQSLKPVRESIERLKQFCADAAHELRTPITVIRANSSVALRHPEGMRDGDKPKFEAIASGVKQMEKLTEDLLSLAKAEQPSKAENDSQPFSLSLNEMVQSVLDSVDSSAKTKGVTLENKLSEPVNVALEESDLNCIVRNLVDNAINYTPRDGKVTVSANTSNGSVKLMVSDTGIGIPPEDIPKVFERFWRADQARSYHSGGNGLGLSIVKAIVDKYEGSIAVSSEPGSGTTFKVHLKTSSREIAR